MTGSRSDQAWHAEVAPADHRNVTEKFIADPRQLGFLSAQLSSKGTGA